MLARNRVASDFFQSAQLFGRPWTGHNRELVVGSARPCHAVGSRRAPSAVLISARVSTIDQLLNETPFEEPLCFEQHSTVPNKGVPQRLTQQPVRKEDKQ